MIGLITLLEKINNQYYEGAIIEDDEDFAGGVSELHLNCFLSFNSKFVKDTNNIYVLSFAKSIAAYLSKEIKQFGSRTIIELLTSDNEIGYVINLYKQYLQDEPLIIPLVNPKSHGWSNNWKEKPYDIDEEITYLPVMYVSNIIFSCPVGKYNLFLSVLLSHLVQSAAHSVDYGDQENIIEKAIDFTSEMIAKYDLKGEFTDGEVVISSILNIVGSVSETVKGKISNAYKSVVQNGVTSVPDIIRELISGDSIQNIRTELQDSLFQDNALGGLYRAHKTDISKIARSMGISDEQLNQYINEDTLDQESLKMIAKAMVDGGYDKQILEDLGDQTNGVFTDFMATVISTKENSAFNGIKESVRNFLIPNDKTTIFKNEVIDKVYLMYKEFIEYKNQKSDNTPDKQIEDHQ